MQPAEKDSFWQRHYTVRVHATDSSLSASQPSMNSPLFSWVEAKVLSHSFLSLESLTYYRKMLCTRLLADLSSWVYMHFVALRYCTFSRAQILYFPHSVPGGRHYFVVDVPQEQSVLPRVQRWLQSHGWWQDPQKAVCEKSFANPASGILPFTCLPQHFFERLSPEQLLCKATSESRSGR